LPAATTAAGETQKVSEPIGWQAILGAVATAAGSAAWVAAVGSAIVGLRLENAKVPAQSVVALMPTEHRFALGASYLIAPLFVGLVGFLADWALTAHWASKGEPGSDTSPPRSTDARHESRPGHPIKRAPAKWASNAQRRPEAKRERLWARAPFAAGTVALGTVAGIVLLRPPLVWLFLLQIAAIGCVVTVVALLSPGEGTLTHERVVVFLLVLVIAGVFAFAFERLRTPEFDFAAVGLNDNSWVTGYYVTTTSNAVLLITLGRADDRNACPAALSRRQVTVLPTDQIGRLWIGPRDVQVSPHEFCKQSQKALQGLPRR
jgi:hypothetical protein